MSNQTNPHFIPPMSLIDTIDIYLETQLLKNALQKQHNFLNQVHDVLADTGADIRYHDQKTAPLVTNEFSLSYMVGPIGQNCAIFRRAYHYPYWYIDTEEERWQWRVAQDHFDPSALNIEHAQTFADRNRARLFPGIVGTDEGFILIPLQGKLDIRRSFQICTPIEMIEHAAQAFPSRRIYISPHPKEAYTDTEASALRAVVDKYDHVNIATKGANDLMPQCHAIVTQNSSVAVSGYLFEKPAVLFGKTDVHHIALRPDLENPTDLPQAIKAHHVN
ncbi:MAG: hypothetical protein AAF701_03225, partial [Pseudomonadota bacterium]